MFIFDATLDGFHSYEEVCNWVKGIVWSESEGSYGSLPHYSDRKDTLGGITIYYDFVGDYYFFTDEDVN